NTFFPGVVIPREKANLLELGRNTEVEVLNLVGVSLRNRERIIEAQRTKRRGPHQAYTCRSAKFLVVAKSAWGIIALKCCCIRKQSTANTEAFWNEWHWELNFSRTVEIGRATQPVAPTAVRILIRADAVKLKA